MSSCSFTAKTRSCGFRRSFHFISFMLLLFNRYVAFFFHGTRQVRSWWMQWRKPAFWMVGRKIVRRTFQASRMATIVEFLCACTRSAILPEQSLLFVRKTWDIFVLWLLGRSWIKDSTTASNPNVQRLFKCLKKNIWERDDFFHRIVFVANSKRQLSFCSGMNTSSNLFWTDRFVETGPAESFV